MDAKLDISDDISQLELHYIFEENDISHSLDAYTRNACEKEFLAIIKTLSLELGIRIDVSVEPKKDGSLIDVYNFLVSQNGLAIAVWANFLLQVVKYVFPRKTKAEKENMALENDNSLLDLIKKAKDLEEQGVPLPPDIEKKLLHIYSSRKMMKQKSNFFKNLKKERKVKSLEISSVNKADETKRQVLFAIPRKDFQDYFLYTDDLESEIDSNAVVEVISPVLKRGKYLWRGIYRKEGQTHEFAMLDKDFKKTVVDDGISFQNGTELDCEVEICKKLDDNGDVFNSKYKIRKVYDHRIGNATTEMPRGKKNRQETELEKKQMKLFDNLDNQDL